MTVFFYGSVLEHTSGAESTEIEVSPTLRALIDALGERFGDSFREFLLGEETCVFLVNGGGIVTTGGLNTPLQSSDKIEVLPFVDGG